MSVTTHRPVEAALAAARMGHRGLIPGAVAGGLLGLVPGLLLVFVVGGGTYHVGGGEMFSFAVMSIVLFTLAGATVGGACAIITGLAVAAIRSRRLRPGRFKQSLKTPR